MVRPMKIGEKTKTYSLTIPEADYDKLSKFAYQHSVLNREQVSVADLIRGAIKEYIIVYEELEDE